MEDIIQSITEAEARAAEKSGEHGLLASETANALLERI